MIWFKRLLVPLLLAAGAVLLAWAIDATRPLQALEERSIDWRFLFRGPNGLRSADIALVLVEEEAELDYHSPIPRRHLAEIIPRLNSARLVGLDIFLDRPSFDREGDARLKEALQQSRKVVSVSILKEGREQLPHEYFREVLLDIGYATFGTGTADEVIRWGTLARELDGQQAWSFAAALYAHAKSSGTKRPDAERVSALTALDSTHQELLINFSGPPNYVYRQSAEELAGGFAVCPSHLVAAGVYPAAFFKDKIVLIGTGLSDAPDRFRMPFFTSAYGYEKMVGVEIHAHFLQMLLTGNLMKSWSTKRVLLLCFALALLVAGGVVYTDLFKSLAFSMVLLTGLWITAFAAFSHGAFVIPVVFPSLSIVGAYGLATMYYGVTEGREKRQTRQLFEKYLAPPVVETLLADKNYWKLGGITMDVTVMFADLEGFTSISEKLATEPEKLVKLINEYLNEMSEIIFRNEGTIDKYEGDLIMAFWGAPIPQEDHAVRACRAALQMQERMAQLRGEWSDREMPELRVRIGLNSGPAVVGNMGSNIRFDYTVMGDTVNLASRLEQENKNTKTYTMISEATRLQAREAFNFRSLGSVLVKGKNVPTDVFELLPLPPSGPDA